jgi:hypothetical protein
VQVVEEFDVIAARGNQLGMLANDLLGGGDVQQSRLLQKLSVRFDARSGVWQWGSSAERYGRLRGYPF